MTLGMTPRPPLEQGGRGIFGNSAGMGRGVVVIWSQTTSVFESCQLSFLPRQGVTLTTGAPRATAAGHSLGGASNKAPIRGLCAGELLYLFLLVDDFWCC